MTAACQNETNVLAGGYCRWTGCEKSAICVFTYWGAYNIIGCRVRKNG